ncbi:MAG TPA: hypothetical protein VJ861_09570 [Treponemataceae bacterium]|nr:hypothetical protein [Treponemataceae bacterium]
MKKALAIFMIFALVASVAFAEITFGAWGRGLFVPVSNTGASDAESVAENKASWGGAPRIGFTIAGNSDNVGFLADVFTDGGEISAGDQQLIWVKPMDMLKISLGRVQVDALRGNAAYGSWNWDRAYGDGDYGDDFTFSRMSTGAYDSATFKNEQGVVFEVAPMDALWVGLALRDVNNTAPEWAGNPKNSKANTVNLLAKMQFALGYTIDGIGQFKAQIIRNPYNFDAKGAADKNNDTVEIAFNLTMVENLFVEAGFRMWTESKENKTKDISLYAKYGMDALTVHFSTRATLDTADVEGKEALGLYVGAGADYDLGNGIGVSGDVRYTSDVMLAAKDAKITVFAGVTKGFSNGLIGAGVEILNQKDTGYSIPVRFEYWF